MNLQGPALRHQGNWTLQVLTLPAPAHLVRTPAMSALLECCRRALNFNNHGRDANPDTNDAQQAGCSTADAVHTNGVLPKDLATGA